MFAWLPGHCSKKKNQKTKKHHPFTGLYHLILFSLDLQNFSPCTTDLSVTFRNFISEEKKGDNI